MDVHPASHRGGSPDSRSTPSRHSKARTLTAVRRGCQECSTLPGRLRDHFRDPRHVLRPTAVEVAAGAVVQHLQRSEEHTSELQSLMRISYAVFCLKKKITDSNS